MAINNVSADSAEGVFDVGNWLERASTRPVSTPVEYVPRHRAEVPADSVA